MWKSDILYKVIVLCNIITHKLERMDIEVKKHMKAFAAICSMAMIFSIFSASVLADDPATGGGNITQQVINDNGGKMPVTGGTYTLTEDVEVSKTAQIETDSANIAIDLNGHTISYIGSGSLYIVGKATKTEVVADNVVLTISNGSITTAQGYTGNGSTDYWVSDRFCDKPDSGRGGCFLLQYGSTLTLNNVAISKFHAKDEGGAIHVGNGSKLYMNGGSITGCTCDNHGGAISVHCSSKGRSSTIGGVTYNICGAAEIRGTTISGNTAKNNGGGVRVLRGDILLDGCVITDNTASSGGGVEIANNDHPQYIKVAGNIQISENHVKSGADTKADLYLTNGKPTIDLAGDLSATAKIRFMSSSMNTNTDYFKINGYSYSLDNFESANTSLNACYYSANDSIRLSSEMLPKVTGCSVAVSGSIEIKPQVALGSFDDDNASVTYSYSYTKNGKTTTKTNTFTKAQLTSVGTNYQFTIPVESSCMTAPIEITIAYGTNGDTVTKTLSIEDYVKAMMADTKGNYTQAEKDAAEALLIYGGYAQVQLGIYADKLPDIGVDFSQAYANAIQAEAYTITKDTYNAYYGVSVSFLTKTEIKMYFKKSVLGDTAPAMTVEGYSDTISASTNGSYYVYTIKGASGNGFSATQYNSSFNFSIGDDISGTYSVETYLKAIKNNSNSSAAMKNLAEAYYNFAQKCIALTLN